MYSDIYKETKEIEKELVEWYEELHQIPEIGLSLPKTSAFVQKKLNDFSIPFETKVNGNCIVGIIGEKGPCLLLRADMDGLPIQEETKLPYASTNGNMHACGHDMHTTALLGAAKLLKKHEKDLHGIIKIVFQPAEETFQGADAAIKEQVLENPKVDAAFALHTASILPVGKIAYGTIPNASVYGFKITIKGKGTHGAMPHKGIDPIHIGVQIYQGLQELVSRECPPEKEVTLTIGQFQAGTSANILPDEAILQGTLRTFDEEIRSYMIKRIQEIVTGMSASYHAISEVEVLCDVPMVICDQNQNERLAAAFTKLSPKIQVLSGLHTTGSEDFALFAKQVPSSYFAVGAMMESSNVYAHHNPKVCFNTKSLPIQTALYVCAGLDWMK